MDLTKLKSGKTRLSKTLQRMKPRTQPWLGAFKTMALQHRCCKVRGGRWWGWWGQARRGWGLEWPGRWLASARHARQQSEPISAQQTNQPAEQFSCDNFHNSRLNSSLLGSNNWVWLLNFTVAFTQKSSSGLCHTNGLTHSTNTGAGTKKRILYEKTKNWKSGITWDPYG